MRNPKRVKNERPRLDDAPLGCPSACIGGADDGDPVAGPRAEEGWKLLPFRKFHVSGHKSEEEVKL